jgi:hypothetical protein
MEWILLESLVALLVLLFIVWWTMRPSRSRDASARSKPADGGDAAP